MINNGLLRFGYAIDESEINEIRRHWSEHGSFDILILINMDTRDSSSAMVTQMSSLAECRLNQVV